MNRNVYFGLFCILFFVSFIGGCNNLSDKEKQYLHEVETFRKDRKAFLVKMHNTRHKDSFDLLNKIEYFEVDTNYIFKSKIYRYSEEPNLEIYKSDYNKLIKVAFVIVVHEGKKDTLYLYYIKQRGVFNRIPSDPVYDERETFLYFYDKTNGSETSENGRILYLRVVEDPNMIYELDFNLAYNQGFDYNDKRKIIIPKENSLDFFVRAGEKKFNNKE